MGFFNFRETIRFRLLAQSLTNNMHSIALAGIVEADLVVVVLFIEVIAAKVLLKPTFDLQLP